MEEVQPSSKVHTSSSVLLLLFTASLVFTFFVFPSFLNHSSELFLLTIKKRWSFLILALVLFAIACGSLRTSDDVGDGMSSCLYPSYHLRSEDGLSLCSFGLEIGSEGCSYLRAQDDERWRLRDHTHLDKGRGFGSKPPYSMRIQKEDGDSEQLFQDKHVVSEDSCDHVAEEPQVPLPPLPSYFSHPVEEKSGKERRGLATRDSSSSLKKKKKKKDRRRESLKKFESSDDSSCLTSLTPMRRHHGWIESDAADYDDSVSEITENPSYSLLGATSPTFCQSPDVNERAEKFIATFKDRLKEEQRNSMKQRWSNLSPIIIG